MAQHADSSGTDERWRPQSFRGFVLDRLLSQDATTGNVSVLGSFKGQEGRVVAHLKRQQFDARRLEDLLGEETEMETTLFTNDIYSKVRADAPPRCFQDLHATPTSTRRPRVPLRSACFAHPAPCSSPPASPPATRL